MFASSKVAEVPESLSAEGNDPVEKEMGVMKLGGGEVRGSSVANYQGLRLGLGRSALSPPCHWLESLARSGEQKGC